MTAHRWGHDDETLCWILNVQALLSSWLCCYLHGCLNGYFRSCPVLSCLPPQLLQQLPTSTQVADDCDEFAASISSSTKVHPAYCCWKHERRYTYIHYYTHVCDICIIQHDTTSCLISEQKISWKAALPHTRNQLAKPVRVVAFVFRDVNRYPLYLAAWLAAQNWYLSLGLPVLLAPVYLHFEYQWTPQVDPLQRPLLPVSFLGPDTKAVSSCTAGRRAHGEPRSSRGSQGCAWFSPTSRNPAVQTGWLCKDPF